ncbi:MAG: hypothetical protein J7M25_12730 [Deltaproteobacteria bacterium]|nr:hypothetical protein [Deltaproteobacteria bacterium]
MFLSKIWTLLLTLFAVLVTVALLLAPRPAEYHLNESQQKQLDVAQALIDMHMQNLARMRLDVLSSIGKDPAIVKPLLQMQQPGATQELSATLKKALTRVIKKSGLQASVIAVTDRTGHVRTRIGMSSRTGDSLAGLPEIQAALKGRCLDNTILRGKTLYWVYVCPVRYARVGAKVALAGSIRAEVPIDNTFVRDLMTVIGQTENKAAKAHDKKKKKKAKRLKIELAFFAKGRLVAYTKGTSLWSKQAPAIYKKYKKEIADPTIGRSPAVPISLEKKHFQMVVGRLRGSASKGNYWALLWKFPEAQGPLAFLSGKTPRSHLLKNFPYALVIIGGLFALALGLFLTIWEGDRPLAKLLRQVRAIGNGEQEKLDETKFRSKFGLTAIAINEALEKAQEHGGGQPALHDKNIDAILQDLEPTVATEDYAPPPASAVAGAPPNEEPAPLDSLLPPVGTAPQPPPFGGSAAVLPSTIQAPTPPAAAGLEFESPASVGDVPPEVENHFKSVFTAFVKTKQQCGEDTKTVTYDAFRQKLKKNRSKIIATQNCRDVTFQVYVKNGKTALKATPQM